MSTNIARRRFLQASAATAALLSARSGAQIRRPSAPAAKPAPQVHLNVRDFSAKADGTTPDTQAFQTALDRCAALGGGEVLIPAGDYLIGAIQLRSRTTLRFEPGAVLHGLPDMDAYPVTQVRWEGKWIPGHIALLYAIDAHDIAVIGPGKILGADSLGGRPRPETPLRHPALMEFLRCDGLHLEGFETHYHLMWSVHPTCSRNITIKGLTIRSTGGNGDGIDIDSCRHVLLQGCDISTGDDCISLKSGRGSEAFAMLDTTEDVTIEDCIFADSIFACIGIGSETSGGIRNVVVRNCRFNGAHSHAVYIKSRPGRGAFIEDLSFDGLDVSNCGQGFLRLNMASSGIQDQDPVPGLVGLPTARNWSFRNVTVHDVPHLVQATELDPRKPLDGLTLSNIRGTCAKGMELANIRHAALRDIHVTGFEGPLLATWNVTGTGLTGAQPLPEPKAPAEVPAPAIPYILH